MDFEIRPELTKTLDEIRSFIENEIYPLEQDVLNKGFDAVLPALAEKREQVKSLGWWAPHLPQQYAGMGLPLHEFAHISEILGSSPVGLYVFNAQAPDVGNMEILIEHGTPEQKEQFLMPLVNGEIRSCFSMTEPAFPGSNPTWMGTQAVREGDSWIIDGRKWFTSSADGASFAIVMAVTDPQAEHQHLRASMIIVPTDTPGFEIVRNISVMGESGSDWASHAEVSYEECRVPLENILGNEGAGFVIAQERLGPGRIHHCMRWIGICERALDIMCRQAATRRLSPDSFLGDSGIVQAWIAESRAEIDAARLMVLRTAWLIDRDGQHAARNEVSTIKFYVAGVLQRVLDRAIQACGGLGMTDDLPLAYWYRHERAARIYDGPDEVHKVVLAKRILRNYRKG